MVNTSGLSVHFYGAFSGLRLERLETLTSDLEMLLQVTLTLRNLNISYERVYDLPFWSYVPDGSDRQTEGRGAVRNETSYRKGRIINR